MSERIPTLPPLPDEDAGRREQHMVVLPPRAVEPSSSHRAVQPVSRGKVRPPVRASRTRYAEGRRLWSAGHAIAVCALALAFGLVLNAPGTHKRAYNLEAGWKRDVALALTGPLATVSETLRLDRPRAALQAAIGRSGEDRIDTDLGIAASDELTRPGASAGSGVAQPPKQVEPAQAEMPVRQAFSPGKKLKVWIAGDSLVITPGYAILRATGASPTMKGLGVDGRVSTGLGRPDVYNWFKAIRDEVRARRPAVVVLSFGGNDDKAYMTGLPEGVSIGSFGDAAWSREYRRRVGSLFDSVNRLGAHAVWIGLPQTSNSSQTQRFDVINAAVAAEARERPETVDFVDTYTLFAGPDGGYAEYLQRPGGRTVKVRASDGVHFEREGGDLIAREVVKILNRRFDLTSWKKEQAGANG